MKLVIDGTALELDMLDADQNARVAEALVAVGREMHSVAGGESAADVIRRQCRAIFSCFDAIFGDGTAERVFGERCNLRRAMRAFERLSRAAARQQAAFVDEMGRAAQRYAPERLGSFGDEA